MRDDCAGWRARWRLWAVLAAGLTLAGCNALSGTGGPTAAIFGDKAGSGAGRATSTPRSTRASSPPMAASTTTPRSSRRWCRSSARIVAASDRPDQSYRITILERAGGQRLRASRRLSLRHPRPAGAGQRFLRGRRGARPRDGARHRQPCRAAPAEGARRARSCSRVVNDVLDNNDAGSWRSPPASGRSPPSRSSRSSRPTRSASRPSGSAGYDPFAAARFLGAMAALRRLSLVADAAGPATGFPRHPSLDAGARRVRDPGGARIRRAGRRRGRPRPLSRRHRRHGLRRRSDARASCATATSCIRRSASASRCRRASSSTTPARRCWPPAPTARRCASTRSALARGTDLADYLKSGWVNGLDEASVQSFSVNGLQAASAKAEAKGWHFRSPSSRPAATPTYRFIFANEAVTPAFTQGGAARPSTASALLSASEMAMPSGRCISAWSPSAPGDTEASLARRMRGVDRPRDLFRVLNDLDAGARHRRRAPGSRSSTTASRRQLR